ncbi:MAG: hypothetical protein KDC14_02425 [Planctomycetes bacterium]|nr:hypothetical protein [Planctomycetota bacterium]
MKRVHSLASLSGAALATAALSFTSSFQAVIAPTDVQQPGTQPLERGALFRPEQCRNCHGLYDESAEPWYQWRGSMMAHATRDPLFWASMAVAEQDFDGAGDLCLRCHSPAGWIEGTSEPTDGSQLDPIDHGKGVTCHLCHTLTDPDDSGPLGVQNAPFIANDGGTSPEGYYGSSMYVLWAGNQRLGPYATSASPHASIQSDFFRESELCGTCHDVSNPVTGDLAPNNGAATPLAPGTFDGTPGAPVAGKAAFNNLPFLYGVLERTFSEHKASVLSQSLVSNYASLPADLRDGSIETAYLAVTGSIPAGTFEDGSPRYFSCQTCHMQPTTGEGASSGQASLRHDLGRHDLTGGSTWIPAAIQYLDAQGLLRVGQVLDADEIQAMDDAVLRARAMLQDAASLEVLPGDVVRVTNLTGHKLLTGYPEGRRMWLNVRWYSYAGELLREDGAYGQLEVTLGGHPQQVDTILDLDGTNTRIYEAHFAMTKEWADTLLGLGYPASLALEYDRVSGQVVHTLGELAAQPAGSAFETFHFALNNTIKDDNRIPPYGMSYDEASLRNALPVPADLYGDPGPGGTYEHWDDVVLSPPLGAATASIELLYQATSWEYIQFLDLANDGSIPFVATAGAELLDAWLNTGMAAPEVMATATWEPSWDFLCFGDGTSGPCPCNNESDPGAGEGCRNSLGWGGTLTASGSPLVAADDFVLHASQCRPGQPGVFLQGANLIQLPFKDGILCMGSPTERLGVAFLDAAGETNSSGFSVVTEGNVSAGTTRYYQYWYRDGGGVSPCVPTAAGSNLTSGLRVDWI